MCNVHRLLGWSAMPEDDRTTVGALIRDLDPDVNRPPDPRRTAGYHYQSAYQS